MRCSDQRMLTFRVAKEPMGLSSVILRQHKSQSAAAGQRSGEAEGWSGGTARALIAK